MKTADIKTFEDVAIEAKRIADDMERTISDIATWRESHNDETFPSSKIGFLAMVDEIQKLRNALYRIIIRLPYSITSCGLPNKSGIYFMVSNGTIMYIGQSVNIRRRWEQRRDFSASMINRVYYMTTEGISFDLDVVEGLLTFLFVPKYNRQINNRVNSLAWDSRTLAISKISEYQP